MSAQNKQTSESAVTEKNETTVVTSFKGFDAEFKCRGHQYQVGATYTHVGKVEPCESGFHACANPLDVLRYYPLLDDEAKPNRFAIVEQSGTIARHDEDSKIASATITITAELSLPEFVKRAVTWVIDHCSKDVEEGGENIQSSSGNSAQLAASGHYAQLAASGHSARLAASGHYAQLAASGDSARLAASGHYARLAASGDSAQLAASGQNSVIASSSYSGIAKGATGTWIALAEFNADAKCVGFGVGCIGQDGLEPEVYYRAKGGKLVRT
jgi:hypothetical protein